MKTEKRGRRGVGNHKVTKTTGGSEKKDTPGNKDGRTEDHLHSHQVSTSNLSGKKGKMHKTRKNSRHFRGKKKKWGGTWNAIDSHVYKKDRGLLGESSTESL